jgi:sucrose synthase
LQEAVVIPPHVAFAIRPNPGFWEFVKVSSDDLSVEAITPADYLKCKEMITDEKWYAFLSSFSSNCLLHLFPILFGFILETQML